MENNKPEATDASEQVVEETASAPVVDEGNDASELSDLFEEEAGTEDVAGKSEMDKLSLDELNNIAGRKDNPFKTKEDFFKHYKNLKSFVGKKETPKEDSSVKEELANLKKDIAKKDFLIETPTAKQYMPILEAYAKDKGVSLSEAWNSDDFKPFAETSPKTVITPNTRINPTTPKIAPELVDEAKKGSIKAQQELVKKWLK